MPLLVLTLLAALFAVWLLGQPYWLARKRAAIAAQPFPDAWRDILRRRVPYVRAMPADLQLQLKKHIQVFIAEKAFLGCAGQVITDEVRVTIAAQACLLLLNRPAHYYPGLRQILVYPGSFVVPRAHTDSAGVAHSGRDVLAGESWAHGQVVLSWQDALEGAATVDDGRNVVIHEFAHQLDQETGSANGAPVLSRTEHYARWAAVLQAEFEALQHSTEQHEETLFDAYGATEPAEFFAVVSEVFFEQPQRMATEHPALYQELAQFYRLDPQSW
ncbi:zinc-dependent peptidase [Rhodoferax saidenbachensis]|uniref:Zinc-dependent peptidase n=1 Tax=Rhodoferax saidenbachensis TaxID=1484693 RepID=A0A1P8KDN1_9BURK|nr:M90 family metallopeptidase [Rhodoferax saidenbachensis]APW44114.1 hypothetical protein RS694_17310 [Rhodoferax saidenbachensis]